MLRRMIFVILASTALAFSGMAAANAAPLPDNCSRTQGTVTCTTFEGPGNNQAGVGETTNTETQGNRTNKSPAEQQDLEDTDSCNPSSSQGRPCNP